MTCTSRFATAADYNRILCAGLNLANAAEVAEVEAILDLAASDLHVNLAAVGACDCTLTSFALVYLKKLNVIDAAVVHNCTCGGVRLSDEQRQAWLQWLDQQMELIRTGKVPLCEDDSGSEYPAFATAEMSYTGWNEANIAANEAIRNTP